MIPTSGVAKRPSGAMVPSDARCTKVVEETRHSGRPASRAALAVASVASDTTTCQADQSMCLMAAKNYAEHHQVSQMDWHHSQQQSLHAGHAAIWKGKDGDAIKQASSCRITFTTSFALPSQRSYTASGTQAHSGSRRGRQSGSGRQRMRHGARAVARAPHACRPRRGRR